MCGHSQPISSHGYRANDLYLQLAAPRAPARPILRGSANIDAPGEARGATTSHPPPVAQTGVEALG